MISFLVGVQVVDGVLLPINLFFIWRLARNAELMGKRRNRGAMDAIAVTVAVTGTLSLALVFITLTGI